jgi:hypothetical protein
MRILPLLLVMSLSGCAHTIFVAPAPESVITAKDRTYVFDPVPEPPMMLIHVENQPKKR